MVDRALGHARQRERERALRQQRDDVPIARTPKPSQIQLTSGLTTTCSVADCSLDVEAGEHDVEVLGRAAADRHLGRRLAPRACGRTTCAGYISPSGLPSRVTVELAVTICFWPSSVTASASCVTVKRPTVTSWPGLQQHLLLALEALAGEAEEHQHDAEVDDVAAVAPPLTARTRPTSAVKRSVPVAPLPHARAAHELLQRSSSATNAHSAKHRPDAQNGTPSATSAPPVDDADARPATGTGRAGSTSVDLRHASSGPTPVSNSSDQADRQHPLVEERRPDRQPLAASPPRSASGTSSRTARRTPRTAGSSC